MNVSWIVEKKVLLVDMGEAITIEEIKVLNTGLLQHLDDGLAPVYVVFAADDLKSFPMNISELMKLYSFTKHPKLAFMISITINRTIRFISKVINRATGLSNVRFADNYHYATQILAELDESLPDISKTVA